MDGPLADFDLYCLDLGLDPSHAKLYCGTYLHLPVTDHALEAVERLTSDTRWDVFVLSKIPSGNPGAATEKHFWLRKYFPTLEKKLILSPDKGCVGSSRDILIDDHPEWANAHNFPGTIIKFDSSHPLAAWKQILSRLTVR